MCVMYAPSTFSQDQEAKVVLFDPEGDGDEAVRTAVEACPTGALALASSEEA